MKRKNKLEILGTQYAKDENTALSNYSMGKSIGEGTFGKVHLGVHNLTNEKVAIKVLEKAKISESDEIERINREIKFLKKFKNINIIKIYEIIETNSKVYFIMEYASGGELYNYIVKKKKLEEKEASFFFAQIVYALEFIHKQNITHRDIKPENMLLTENKTIKLIDFGLSNQYNKGGLLKTPCGSPCYAAPEMILGRRYNGMHIDIWSLGIALFAMICGHLPFEDENNDKLYKKILDCKLQFKSHVSDIARDIISKILSVNPNKRIGFEEIKSHAFFKLSNEMINKKNLGLYLNKVDNSILDKMVELGFEKNNIISNVESNNHNNITTTYELLLNKYKGIGDVSLNINNKISNNNVINNSKNHLINQNKDSKLCNKDSNNNNNITTLNKQKLNSNLCNINNTTTNNNNNNILTKSNAIDIKTKQDSSKFIDYKYLKHTFYN